MPPLRYPEMLRGAPSRVRACETRSSFSALSPRREPCSISPLQFLSSCDRCSRCGPLLRASVFCSSPSRPESNIIVSKCSPFCGNGAHLCKLWILRRAAPAPRRVRSRCISSREGRMRFVRGRERFRAPADHRKPRGFLAADATAPACRCRGARVSPQPKTRARRRRPPRRQGRDRVWGAARRFGEGRGGPT